MFKRDYSVLHTHTYTRTRARACTHTNVCVCVCARARVLKKSIQSKGPYSPPPLKFATLRWMTVIPLPSSAAQITRHCFSVSAGQSGCMDKYHQSHMRIRSVCNLLSRCFAQGERDREREKGRRRERESKKKGERGRRREKESVKTVAT